MKVGFLGRGRSSSHSSLHAFSPSLSAFPLVFATYVGHFVRIDSFFIFFLFTSVYDEKMMVNDYNHSERVNRKYF